MATRSFLQGEPAVIDVTVTDAAGAAVDPGTLSLRIKLPDGSVTTHTLGAGDAIVRDGVGAYSHVLMLSAAGTYYWRWDSGMPNAGAAEGSLYARASRVIA